METKIERKIVKSDIDYGQIYFTGESNTKARKLFESFIGKSSFTIETPEGNFPVHFNDHDPGELRISCTPFFGKLQVDDIICLTIKDPNTISITVKKPVLSMEELLKIIESLRTENDSLKTCNEVLKKPVNQESYTLSTIFDSEEKMENWLEKNMAKVIPNLKVIARQAQWKWSDGCKSIVDLLCMDVKTHELVIVENKIQGNIKAVYPQSRTYQEWAIQHLEQLNEEYKSHDLKATEDVKVVIITDKIEESLIATCKKEGFSLIQIKGGLIFEPILPYKRKK
jgi:hypothetical protein